MTSAVDGGQPGWSKAGATLVNPIMYRLAKRWYEWFRTGVDEASPGAAQRRLVSPRLADATDLEQGKDGELRQLLTNKYLQIVYPRKLWALNLSQFVEGRRWCPWAREGIEEVRVFAGDEPCHREETHRASARLYALQTAIN